MAAANRTITRYLVDVKTHVQVPTPYIETFTGKTFSFLAPQPEDICIEDIAHATSMLCRFTGHCKYFYSVAEHCVAVSRLCSVRNDIAGLLHDSAEAYVNDMNSPL